MSEKTGEQIKKIRIGKLRTAADVSLFLERVIKRVVAGKMKNETATKIGYLVSLLLQFQQWGELQKILEQCELNDKISLLSSYLRFKVKLTAKDASHIATGLVKKLEQQI